MTLALVAPPDSGAAPSGPDTAPSPGGDVRRGYDGPLQVESDAAATEPEVAPEPVEPVPVEPAPVEPTVAPEPLPPEVAAAWAPRKKRPAPRALATIDGYGYPESEIAT
ncbi:MAG: hypothetical protein JNK45_03825, partial [Myxococcales bacterium]|nr:hypothetical protein [Myxococcales bacterium]